MHPLTSALDGGEWPASCPGHFTPQEKSPWYPLVKRLCGPQNRSGQGVKEENSPPPPGIEPRSSYRPTRNQSIIDAT